MSPPSANHAKADEARPEPSEGARCRLRYLRSGAGHELLVDASVAVVSTDERSVNTEVVVIPGRGVLTLGPRNPPGRSRGIGHSDRIEEVPDREIKRADNGGGLVTWLVHLPDQHRRHLVIQ